MLESLWTDGHGLSFARSRTLPSWMSLVVLQTIVSAHWVYLASKEGSKSHNKSTFSSLQDCSSSSPPRDGVSVLSVVLTGCFQSSFFFSLQDCLSTSLPRDGVSFSPVVLNDGFQVSSGSVLPRSPYRFPFLKSNSVHSFVELLVFQYGQEDPQASTNALHTCIPPNPAL